MPSEPSPRALGSSIPGLAFWRALAPFAFAAPLAAQAQFDELLPRGYPHDAEVTEALRVGDLDGDGDLDVIAGMSFPGVPNRLYRNDGRGRFRDDSAASLPPDADETRSLALGDIDGDGDLDLLAGNYDQDRLYRNDGSGRFTGITATHLPVDSDDASAAEFADLDRDGDLDLVVANSRGANRLYLNDGAGRFARASTARFPALPLDTRAIAIGDIDADLDLDIIFGNHGQNRIYRNDGTGSFTDATTQLLPTRRDAANGLGLGDLDGDGDLDLYVANGGLQLQDALLLNDGGGRFSEVGATQLPVDFEYARSLALGDVDRDGDLDVVLGMPPGQPAKRNVLYRNDGSARFRDDSAQSLPLEGEDTRAMVLADLDADGDLDLLCGNGRQVFGEPDRLLWNDGTGRFTLANESPLPPVYSGARALAFGDFDADGRVDVVLGHDNGPANVLLRRDDDERFADLSATHLPPTGEWTSALAPGDLDGDGDLDLILAGAYRFNGGAWVAGRTLAYFNDGAGRFTDRSATALPFAYGDASAVVLGDLDLDGDLDLILGHRTFGSTFPGQDQLFRNDGTGSFTEITATHFPADPSSTRALALGDLDGDGDLDAAIGKDQGPSRIYRNAGGGRFVDVSATALPPGVPPTNALALGDLDGDGDLDLLVAPQGAQKRFYANDGSGNFRDETAARLPLDTADTVAVALGDVDGDGHLDLALADVGQDRLYRNDGTGVFADVSSPRLPIENRRAWAVALLDLDRDGDLDLWSSDENESRLLWNLRRHLDAPYPLRLGHEYVLEAHAAYGPPRQTDLALVLLSPLPADLLLPEWGWLGLSPTALLPLPWLVISPATARGAHTIPVPRDLDFAGATIYAQLLLVQVPHAPRFGPRIVERLER
jgi:hypothetical protein